MQLRAGGEGARSWYIQWSPGSSRAAGGRENAIICLINSNFWWNVSSLVSFSVSALLADYYNKTHLDQVTSIKTPQWALSDWVCHTTFYFPIAVKTCWIISIKFENFRKRSSPVHQLSREKIISNRLVRQFLVRAAFSPNNGAQWVFSETHREWAWLSSSAVANQKLSQNGEV